LENYKSEQQKVNDKFNRYIYIVSGIVLACSVGWAVVGSYISTSFSKMLVLVADQNHELHTQKPPLVPVPEPLVK